MRTNLFVKMLVVGTTEQVVTAKYWFIWKLNLKFAPVQPKATLGSGSRDRIVGVDSEH